MAATKDGKRVTLGPFERWSTRLTVRALSKFVFGDEVLGPMMSPQVKLQGIEMLFWDLFGAVRTLQNVLQCSGTLFRALLVVPET